MIDLKLIPGLPLLAIQHTHNYLTRCVKMKVQVHQTYKYQKHY